QHRMFQLLRVPREFIGAATHNHRRTTFRLYLMLSKWCNKNAPHLRFGELLSTCLMEQCTQVESMNETFYSFILIQGEEDSLIGCNIDGVEVDMDLDSGGSWH
ncbi:2966_t:CDS:2, partial [Dentiscutata heterogama]